MKEDFHGCRLYHCIPQKTPETSMCGICGIMDFGAGLDLESGVRRMARAMAHRGPDDEDVRVFGPAGDVRVSLGHRRLAVIDLSPAARQPMTGSRETALVFNGEIYNFLEKRAACPEYPFRSQSDTEVILALYEKHLDDFVRHLEGMFALALWDGKERKLFLARDRAGKKPLFYCWGTGFFAFASEIKSLLALRELSLTLNPTALPLYLTFGYVPTPNTFYKEVQRLEPGCVMVVDGEQSAEAHPFWQYPLPAKATAGRRSSIEDQERMLRDLLQQAVSRRMIADVPLGAFLSGGIDSSIIVGIMSRLSKEPVKTFSIGFRDDPAYDETPFARLAASKFGTQHTEFKVQPDAISLLEKLIWHYDEPFGDSSAIPTYVVSQLAREHVTVALSGDGGDELFAGYERMAAVLWTEKLPGSALRAGRFLAQFLPAPAHAKNTRRRIRRFFEKAALPLSERYLGWNSFFNREEVRSMCRDKTDIDVGASHEKRMREASSCTLLQQILYLNFKTYLLDDLLVKTDRMSMAHGLEVRCPFLDTPLVEWAATLPDDLKIRRGGLKYLLRRAYRDMLPREILSRSKMGFGVPLGHWMRHELRDFSHDLLLGPSAMISELIDPQYTHSLLLEHEHLIEDHGQRIWALLCLELWLRTLGRLGAQPVRTREMKRG